LRKNARKADELRPVSLAKGFCPAADGSALICMGDTRVICAATVSNDVPDHARSRATGWLTAEYTMLPYATSPRTARRTDRPDGRSVEIQRLIGRSLRSVVDLALMQGFAITVDCDVLQADGGTRTASITGGYVAMRMAIESLISGGKLGDNPLRAQCAAVSAGYVKGEALLDLEYTEDSRADVDMNVVMDGNGNIIEVQGTGERSVFTRIQMDELVSLSERGIRELFRAQAALFP
jgi:ribonuclease PH